MKTKTQQSKKKELDQLVAALKATSLGRRARFRGQGAYTPQLFAGQGKYTLKDFGNHLKKEARTIGKAALRAGLKEGSRALIRGATTFAGEGSYKANALVSGPGIVTGRRGLTFRSSGNESNNLTVSMREYIGDAYGTAYAFSHDEIPVNPGLFRYNPKVAQIAANFKKYRVKKLMLHFEPLITDGATTLAGSIALAFNPDPTEQPFTSKRTMEDAEGSQGNVLTEPCSVGVECNKMKGGNDDWLSVRSGPVPNGADPTNFDYGFFQVALVNSPSGYISQSVGALYMEYTFELSSSCLTTALGFTTGRDSFLSVASSNPTGANLLGPVNSPFNAGQQNAIGCLVTPTGVGYTITFPLNFEGAVRISLTTSTRAAVAGVAMSTSTSVSGQISPINDLYNLSGAPTNVIVSNGVAVSGTGVYNYDADYYISPAAYGANNVITVLGSVGCTSAVAHQCEISVYNAFGLSPNPGLTAIGPNVYKNSNTGATTTVTSI